jgi:hypothetical protein
VDVRVDALRLEVVAEQGLAHGGTADVAGADDEDVDAAGV